jgi:hypothetical protein
MVNAPLTARALRSVMIETPNDPSLNCLVELAHRDGVDIRPTLLRVMTDLYLQKPMHSAEEEQHFTELALRLFDLVDGRTRAIVAEKIAGYAKAPKAVRERALRDRIGRSESASASSASDPFAGATVMAEELNELFFAANPEERRLILSSLPYAPLLPAEPIPPALAREAIDRMETAALEHHRESFARELECALAISPALARRLLDDPSGEPIVVAAVALGMPASVLQRILLCLTPAISQSVQRVYDLALLQEEIAPDAALRLLAIWRSSHKALDRRPQPPVQNDRPPAAVSPAPQIGSAPARRTLAVARPKILWDEHARSRKESA